MANVNEINLFGRLKRLDVVDGMTNDNRPWIKATLTLVVEENEIQVGMFSMCKKNNGDDMSSATAINTLYDESFALYKSRKKGKEDAVVEKKENNDTIVDNIDECEVIKCSSYKDFKYCRFENDVFMKDNNVVKRTKIVANYVNRGKEDEEYSPKNEFEITGRVAKVPMEKEKNDEPYISMSVIVPVFNKGYKKKDGTIVEDSVDLQEIELECHDENAFDYIIDNFSELNRLIYVNGEIFRHVERIEIKNESEDLNRGFGKKITHATKYETKVDEHLEITGGYELEEEELENEPSFNEELWSKGIETLEKKIEDLKNGEDKKSSGNKGFGRTENKKPSGAGKLPF